MRVTSKGQFTIPKAIRERCGPLPHTEVRFVEEGGLTRDGRRQREAFPRLKLIMPQA